MKEIENSNSKYSELMNIVARTAAECGCSECYVRKIMNGDRVAKTGRATKARRVCAVLDRLLSAFDSQNQQNHDTLPNPS